MKHLLIMALVSVSAFSQTMPEQMQNRAETLGGAVGNVIGPEGVKQTQQAMMGDGQITTLNGATAFSSQASCGSDAHYLNINGSFNASGLNVNITADTNLDGAMDSSYSVSGIDGLCSNGYFKCASPSTATGCDYYEWVGHPLGDIQRTTAQDVQRLYNCQCIHGSCDPNSFSYLDKHLETVGSGMVQNYQKQNPYFAVSNVEKVGPNLQFHGRVSTACSAIAPDPGLSSYFNNPHSQAPAASAEQASNHYYQVASNSAAQVDNSVETSCAIIRDVQLNEVQRDDIINFLSHSGASVSSCGTGCINVILGSGGDNNLHPSDGCDYFDAHAQFDVKRPDLITSVELLNYSYDDMYHLDINDSTIISTHGFLKTNPEPASCEYGVDNHYPGPSIDVTGHFLTAGIKTITATVAVGGLGDHRAHFRIRFQESDETTIGVYAASQGRIRLECDYDLKIGSMTCVSDGITTVQHIDNSISYEDACASGTSSIQVIGSGNGFNPDTYWPGQITGSRDDTISVSVVHPSCSNNLIGSFEIIDTTSASNAATDTTWYLAQFFRYRIETSECTVNQSIIDNCAALPLDDCSLKNHSFDGVPILANYSPTGNTPTTQTQTIVDGNCAVTLTEDFFTQNKTYTCPSAPPTYSVDTSHLQEPTFSGQNMTITTRNPDPSDPMAASTLTMPIPELPEDKPCAFQCRVKRTTNRNQVNASGNETNERGTGVTTEIFTRDCYQDVCPLESGETIIEACTCLNEFAQVAASLEVLKLAGKDITCVVP